MDGESTIGNISNVFSQKMQALLSAEDTQSRTDCFKLIAGSITPPDLLQVSVASTTVKDAIARLKNDGTDLNSNHLVLAPNGLVVVLSRLFTSLVRHGYMPKCIRNCILRPIPKPGKDPTLSDNYRPIALVPILSKVLESCILIEYQSYLITTDLQFGFKPGASTDLCTGLIKNVISQHIMFNDTNVYGCFLDASKAFDRVSHSILFDKLLTRKLPLPVLIDFCCTGTVSRRSESLGSYPSLAPLLLVLGCAKVGSFLHCCLQSTSMISWYS